MVKFKTTAKKLCEDLETLCKIGCSYNNTYPYNLLYYGVDKRFSADCVNLIKALVNGREIKNPEVGSFQNDLSVTGDCTEWGLLKQCVGVTTDFAKMDSNPHVLYLSGHVGVYLGYEVCIDGKIYNTVECTTWTGDFGNNGVIYSFCDSCGSRLNHKDGTVKSYWTHNGDMSSIVDCSILKNKDYFYMSYLPNLQKGDRGNVVKNIQCLLNLWTTQSGYYPPIFVDGEFGSYTEERVKLYQRLQNLPVTGVVDKTTWNDILLG